MMLILALLLASSALANPLTSWHTQKTPLGELQLRLAALEEGDTLALEPGVHEGPIVIRTEGITIKGADGTTIKGSGKGSVIVIEADGVTLENLEITGSGESYDQVDAGVAVRNAKNITLRGLTISDCLFGIDVANAQNIAIENNRISSRNLSLGLRGDAIRLWSAKNVRVHKNFWSDTRDVVSWYSQRVTFSENEATRARYSIHGMYSNSMVVKNNHFHGNSVGVFIMYGEGSTILDNLITNSLGTTGMGLGMKETSSVYASGNRFLYCAVGILVDNSPWDPTSRNWFQNNEIAFNTVGILFSNSREGNEFSGNRFQSNHVNVESETRVVSNSRWHGNYWDDYDGFDRDDDGVGDTPFRVYRYSDLMSSSQPATGFFYGSPVASLVGLVERLLPLTSPIKILEDDQPRLIRKGRTL